MNITVINGTEVRGVTFHLKELFLEAFTGKATITEFYLPKDSPGYCMGCKSCIFRGERKCKDAEAIGKIEAAILEADLLVFTSPAYVFHVTVAMKSLLDHLAYRCISHRPAPQMFGKRAVIITQCLGMGAKSAAKDFRDSLNWWGVSKIGEFSSALMSDIFWAKLPAKKQAELSIRIQKLSRRFARIDYSVPARANLLTKLKFYFCRMMQRSLHKTDPDYYDANYWAAQGWLDGALPW